jgi:hypothetical protein
MASAAIAKLGEAPQSEEPIAEVVSELADMIGRKFIAYMTSVNEAQVIERWINGTVTPPDLTEERLRLAHKISKVVSSRCDKDTVQAWLQGKNPDLNDQTVLVMIREEAEPSTLEAELVSAAEQFSAK